MIFDNVIDNRISQTFALRVIGEVVSIKPAEAFPGPEPKIAFRILQHRGDVTVCQAIGNVVMSNRKLLPGDAWKGMKQKEKKQLACGNRPRAFHAPVLRHAGSPTAANAAHSQ